MPTEIIIAPVDNLNPGCGYQLSIWQNRQCVLFTSVGDAHLGLLRATRFLTEGS